MFSHSLHSSARYRFLFKCFKKSYEVYSLEVPGSFSHSGGYLFGDSVSDVVAGSPEAKSQPTQELKDNDSEHSYKWETAIHMASAKDLTNTT